MKHTKQDLEDSIREMESVYHDADTPQNIKDSIKYSLDNAKKLLHELQASEAVVHKPTAAEISKAIHKGETKVKVARAKPLTRKQQKKLTEIVAESKKYAAYAGYSEEQLRRDAERKGKRPGKRTSASGKTYYESRPNRSDVNERAPHLAKGGKIPQNIYEAKESNSEFGIKKGDKLKVYKEYFRNGESHFIGVMNSKSVDIPAVLFERAPHLAKGGTAKGGTILKGGTKPVFLKREKGGGVPVIPNYQTIANLLNNGSWDYVYNMQRVDEDIMRSLISQIEDYNITADMVEKEYANLILNLETFDDNEQIAQRMADSIAQNIVECPYETVTFTVTFDNKNQYADGGPVSDNQITFDGYTTTNFTPAAKAAFEKAIEELESDKNKDEFHYHRAKSALKTLAQNVNTLLKPNQDAEFVHEMLQSVGYNNYKTGLLLDTTFLNKELAARKLEKGGQLQAGGLIHSLKDVEIIDQTDHGVDQIVTYKNSKGEYWTVLGHYGKLTDIQLKSGDQQQAIKNHKKWSSFAKGGRLKSALMRDRKYKSNEPWEQNYDRKGAPKNPRYKYAGGGLVGYMENMVDKIINHYLPGGVPNEVFSRGDYNNPGDYRIDTDIQGDGSKNVFINVYFADQFAAADHKLTTEYNAYAKFLEDLAAKKGYNAEILTNEEDSTVMFKFFNVRTSKMAKGGRTGKYVASRFTINDSATYPGYHVPGEDWNGWATPVFEKSTALKILSDTKIPYKEEDGKIVAALDYADEMSESEYEYEDIGPSEITVNGKKIKVYSVGAYSWVWDEVSSDTPPQAKYTKDGSEWQADIGGFVGHDSTKQKAYAVALENWKENHKKAKGGSVSAGRSRDRKFKSKEPWEQKYKRKTLPKNPVYKKSSLKEAAKISRKLKKNKK